MRFDFPKIELHLHLEGMVPFSALKSMYENHSMPVPAFLQNGFPADFPTFSTFVQSFYACCTPILREEDFGLYVSTLADYVAENQIAHAEISWTPFFYLQKGLSFEKIMGILNEEMEKQNIRSKIRFIIDVQRDHGDEIMDLVFSKLTALHDFQIAGIGMTGDEYEPIPRRAIYWFEKLKEESNLGRTVHTGEYGSPDKIQEVIEKLRPERLGHGINAIQSEQLLLEIKDRSIHLENCPTSNLKLHRVANYHEHPIHHFLRKGISVGINSDDPGIFNMTIRDELEKSAEIFGFSEKDLGKLNQNAIEAAFISREEKNNLLETVNQFYEK